MTEQIQTTKQNQAQVQRGQRRGDFIQTRKSLPYSLQVQSDAMLRYMRRNGGAASGAFQRVAGLIQLTANEPEIRERLDAWFDGVISVASERAQALRTQQEKFAESMVFDVPRPKIPENYKHTVEVTHPIFWKYIGLVEMIDGVMAEIEFLWLAGHLEDVHLENAAGQAVNTIRQMVNRIYYVTNASRQRKGGLYSDKDYRELMRALTKDEEAPEQPETKELQPAAE